MGLYPNPDMKTPAPPVWRGGRRLEREARILVFSVAGRGQARRGAHQEGRGFVAETDHAAIIVVFAAADRLDAAHRQRRATDGTFGFGARGALGFAAGLFLARLLAALGATVTAAVTAPLARRTVAFDTFGTRRALGLDLGLLGVDARLFIALGTTIAIASALAATATARTFAFGAFRARGAFWLDLGRRVGGVFDARLTSAITRRAATIAAALFGDRRGGGRHGHGRGGFGRGGDDDRLGLLAARLAHAGGTLGGRVAQHGRGDRGGGHAGDGGLAAHRP